jgi:cytidylate kinase
MTTVGDRRGRVATDNARVQHGPIATTTDRAHIDSNVMDSTRVRRKLAAMVSMSVRDGLALTMTTVAQGRRLAGVAAMSAATTGGAALTGRTGMVSDVDRVAPSVAVSGTIDLLGRRAVDRVDDGARVPVGRLVVRNRRQVVLSGDLGTMSNSEVEQEVAVSDRQMTIAIDGPAAAGKSTVGEIVARKIDGVYFDTGILYRALTLLALEAGIASSDEAALASLASDMDIQIGRPTVADGRQVDVVLGGRDVTHSLRTSAIDRNVSAVSAHSAVRDALLEQQRRIGRSGRVVMVGRDIGTVVIPDAELKIFLDASPEERARRRCVQLEEMDRPLPYDDVLADMKRRDRIDSERDVAPLRPADDAVVIDSDQLTIEEVADLIVRHAQHQMATTHS